MGERTYHPVVSYCLGMDGADLVNWVKVDSQPDARLGRPIKARFVTLDTGSHMTLNLTLFSNILDLLDKAPKLRLIEATVDGIPVTSCLREHKQVVIDLECGNF